MQIETNKLIAELLLMTEQSSSTVRDLKTLSDEQLNYKREISQWSILECIEHLNLYGDYYLPAIEKQILANKSTPNSAIFKSCLLYTSPSPRD